MKVSVQLAESRSSKVEVNLRQARKKYKYKIINAKTAARPQPAAKYKPYVLPEREELPELFEKKSPEAPPAADIPSPPTYTSPVYTPPEPPGAKPVPSAYTPPVPSPQPARSVGSDYINGLMDEVGHMVDGAIDDADGAVADFNARQSAPAPEVRAEETLSDEENAVLADALREAAELPEEEPEPPALTGEPYFEDITSGEQIEDDFFDKPQPEKKKAFVVMPEDNGGDDGFGDIFSGGYVFDSSADEYDGDYDDYDYHPVDVDGDGEPESGVFRRFVDRCRSVITGTDKVVGEVDDGVEYLYVDEENGKPKRLFGMLKKKKTEDDDDLT